MSGLFSVFVVAATSSVSAQDAFQFTGACDENQVISGLQFMYEGKTLSGAPFYKAFDHEYYVFYEPDCMNSGDGTPRWIINEHKPDQDKSHDLDSNGLCDYVARFDSEDTSEVPSGEWTMNCGGKMKKVELQAQEVPIYKIEGACDANLFIQDLQFVHVGETKSGAPFYKALAQEYYIYHEPDCKSSGDGTPRWILEVTMPNRELDHDLDEDGRCDYIARVDSTDLSSPPSTGEWSMKCGDTSELLELTFSEVDIASTTHLPTRTRKKTTTELGSEATTSAGQEDVVLTAAAGTVGSVSLSNLGLMLAAVIRSLTA